MTSLTTAGSLVLQELAAGQPADGREPRADQGTPVGGPALGHTARLTRDAIEALGRTHDRTRRALASQAALAGSRREEE